jgi:bifunctional N-acetylglucosamine-1-phosphate-uridyltransferase/glucosamine-1-phosphate-acetyltransferase GlmU-like protein
MEIIVPAAGLSTRFPNMHPKYILTDFSGKLMLERAIESFLGKYKITIGILQEHESAFGIRNCFKDKFGDNINLVVLKERTNGPADTVYQIIKQSNIFLNQEILIKDCDSFFNHTVTGDNYVCISKIGEHEILKRLSAKSFIVSNDQGIITNIIEKQVVSDKFCVGGYKFESAKLFCDTFEKLKNKNIGEIFVSHVIEDCLYNNIIFTEQCVTNYVDVGTAADWVDYNTMQNRTI